MADTPVIHDLHQVIEPFLDGGKLLKYSSRYLTKPGDNYGSIMLALETEIRTSEGKVKNLSLVAKLPPLTNDLFWQMFQPERTCLTENAIYKYLSPAIRNLQLQQGVEESQLFDGFSKYYGSRISLDANATLVDRAALLVQENLQISGFRAGNRLRMFDLSHAQIILAQVARFHALPIALRLLQPQLFERDIRPYFRRFNMNNGMSEEGRLQYEEELYGDVASVTKGDVKILQRIKELVDVFNRSNELPEKEDDLFSTIVHSDLWVNNLMIKYDDSDLPSQVKLIDFQMSEYESLANDVIFFLFSSVEVAVLDSHLDDLLQLYYQSFIRCLQSVGVPLQDYSYVSFMKEIHKYAPISLIQCLQMIRVILADQSTMPESFKDVNLEVLSKNVGNERILQRTADVIRLAIKYRFLFED